MRRSQNRRRQWLAAALLAAYGGSVLLVTMWPVPVDRGYRGTISAVLEALHSHGLPLGFGYSALEFSANVAMFVPIGLLVTLILPRGLWWLALLLCPALSVAIETAQGVFLPARFASVSDVASNSVGAVIGVLIALIVRAIVWAHDDRSIAPS